jgi:hypothetical protein
MSLTAKKDHTISEQPDKVIVTKKPSRVMIYDDVAAKTNTGKLCGCRYSEPGKVSLDTGAHESGCHIRKRLLTGRFTVDTSVTPRKITDRYGLGVALGEVNY